MTNDNLEKLRVVAGDSLREDAWVWYSADGSDRLFDMYLTDKYSSPTYGIVTAGAVRLLVSTLDAEIDYGIDALVYSNPEHLTQLLAEQFDAIGWPARVFLNFSQSADPKVDSLGHGVFLSLVKKISEIYANAGHDQPSFESAEELFYALIERRSTKQVERMKIAAQRTSDILRSSLSRISAGMSERDIFVLVQETMLATQGEFCSRNGVSVETYAWTKEACPVVLVGPNLQKGGHAETSDYCIREGETVYADFGVKLTFADGGVASSDLQRMAYLPGDGDGVPEEVQKVFSTLATAIRDGISQIRPGMFGYEVDAIVRAHITDAGYPSYDHSTGHPIGEVAHSPGTLLGPKESPRARRKIQNFGTYTIEPRCQVPNGGSIEEVVLVTEQGGVTLCDPQNELWIIGRNM